MKKKLIILSVIGSVVISLLGVSIYLYSTMNQNGVTQYNKNGIKFSYFNSWRVSDKTDNEAMTTINLAKNLTSSAITIEVKELPQSYAKFTHNQIIDAVKLQIEDSNKDLVNIYSGSSKYKIGNYNSTELLYKNKDNSKQVSVIIGEDLGSGGNKLFAIMLESARDNFDLMLYDLDAITNSIEIK